jgi:hypothetical protein
MDSSPDHPRPQCDRRPLRNSTTARDAVARLLDPLGRRTGRVGPKVASPGTGESRWRYLDQLRIGAGSTTTER